MVAVPTWQPGTLYQPGDIVQPITAPAPTAAQVENGDFAAGNVNWDFTGGAEFSTTGGYSGNGNCVRMPGNVPDGLALNRTQLVVPSTGSTFEATAMIQQGASIAGATRGWVEVRWYDIDDVQISLERGNVVSDGSGGAWHQSKVTATRPAGAAYARAGIALFSVADHNHPIWGDNLVVSGTFAGLPEGLVYKAVQPESGFSDADEPEWPPILGQQVIDNEVIWEAVASTRVTWEASPIYVSGAVEPVWPTEIGGFVRDGTIDWKTVSRRVEDPNCPDSNIVVIGASKVFVGDDDIVKYSATVNPLDWTSADDAGYLPTGLQNYGANPVSAMGLYRGNLVVFNSEAFQLWQIDEDPASMAFIDALPLGSTQHRSIAPVSNDLLFLTAQGIRSIGIAASSTNYQAGDVGTPIDELVQQALRVAGANGSKVLGTYSPGAGQYMVAFSEYPPSPLGIQGALPDSELGQPVDFQYTVTGGVAPYGAVVLSSGSLPPGLTLEPNGRVHGTTTVAGTYSWVVSTSDSDASTATHPDSVLIGKGVGHVFKVNLYTGNGIQPRSLSTLDFTDGGACLVRVRGDDWTRLLWADAPGAADMKSFSGAAAETPSVNLIASDGVRINTPALNTLGANYFGYSFANYPRFAQTVTWVGNGAATQDIPHDLGVAPGAILVMPPGDAAFIDMYHRMLGATQYIPINGPAFPITESTAWGDTSPGASTFRVGSRYNAGTVVYTALVLAHDEGPDGFIQCGSYVGNGLPSGPVVSLGWQPQMLLIKNLNGGNAFVTDTARNPGFAGNDEVAYVSVSNLVSSGFNLVELVPDGFQLASSFGDSNANGRTHVYVAVRAP